MIGEQYAYPSKVKQPADPGRVYNGKGQSWLRSEIARTQLRKSDPNYLNPKDLKPDVEPPPRLDAPVLQAIFTRMYAGALAKYEGDKGGVPSKFSAVPLIPGVDSTGVHAPKLRHMTMEEQKAARAQAAKEGRRMGPNDYLTKVAPRFKPGDLGSFIQDQALKNFLPTELPMTRKQQEDIKKQATRKAIKSTYYNSRKLEGDPSKATYSGYVRQDQQFDPNLP